MNDDGPFFEFEFPSKLSGYLRRLLGQYGKSHPRLAEVVSSARVYVEQGTSYDRWDGGLHGHDVRFFLPPEVMGNITIGSEPELADTIRSDLNHCAAALAHEVVNRVVLEQEDDSDPKFQQALPVSRVQHINPEALSIWKSGHVRLFISHRDGYKRDARSLADELEEYGVSSFVAHDTIEPLSTWQREITKGLQTMEVMLAYITDDFYDSVWTNQEIGFALGRSIPIIPLKLQQADPKGFNGAIQALRGNKDEPSETAVAVYDVLAEKLGNKARLQQGLINAFTASASWEDAKKRFERMANTVKSLSEQEADQIGKAFAANQFLYSAYYLHNYGRLKGFLEKATACPVVIDDRAISFQRTPKE